MKNRGDAPSPDSGTTATSSVDGTADTAVAIGAHDSAELSSESMANAAKAAKAGLGAGRNTVHFMYDSDAIASADMELLKKHASFIKANPAVSIRLEGHTDERGTQEYNLALGERRAKAVAMFLRAHGVAGSQLEIISYGELKPLANSEDEEAMAQNRRVEVVYR